MIKKIDLHCHCEENEERAKVGHSYFGEISRIHFIAGRTFSFPIVGISVKVLRITSLTVSTICSRSRFVIVERLPKAIKFQVSTKNRSITIILSHSDDSNFILDIVIFFDITKQNHLKSTNVIGHQFRLRSASHKKKHKQLCPTSTFYRTLFYSPETLESSLPLYLHYRLFFLRSIIMHIKH